MGAAMFDSALRLMRTGIEAAHGPLPEGVDALSGCSGRLYGGDERSEARAAIRLRRRVPPIRRARRFSYDDPERVALRLPRSPPVASETAARDPDAWDVDDSRWTDEIIGNDGSDDDWADTS